MTKRARLITKIVCWGLFLTAAPLVLGYAFGHRISPSSPVPRSVGAFLVRTIPRGATVVLNGEKISDRTHSSISSLKPGNYHVRIEKNGYKAWEKNLSIEGTKITDIRQLRLIPKNIEQDIVRGSVVNYSISPSEDWLSLAETTGNFKQVRTVPLDNFVAEGTVLPRKFSRKAELSYLWSPNEDYFILVERH